MRRHAGGRAIVFRHRLSQDVALFAGGGKVGVDQPVPQIRVRRSQRVGNFRAGGIRGSRRGGAIGLRLAVRADAE